MAFRLALLSALAFSSFSYAEEFPQQLKILGRGIYNKKEKKSLAVACTGAPEAETGQPSCTTLRVVIFEKGKTPTWFGDPISIQDATRFPKAFKKAYKEHHRIDFGRVEFNFLEHDPERAGKYMIGSFLITCLFWTRIPEALLLNVALPAAALVVIFGIMDNHGLDPLAMPVNGALWLSETIVNGVTSPIRGIGNTFVGFDTSVMTEQDGWNWIEKPKRVSNRKFERIKEVLEHFKP